MRTKEEMKGNNRPQLKRQNAASIKESIYKYGPVSRSELAQRLGLTPPTITTQVAELISMGVIRECGSEATEGQVGRRPVKIDFVPTARYALGIELGPYQTHYSILDLRGNSVYQWQTAPCFECYEAMLEQLKADVATVLKSSGVAAERLLGAGVGLPGFIDGPGGVIRSNFRENWNGRPLARDIGDCIGIPVCIQNNVRARAIGQVLFRFSQYDSFAYYYVSHGVACSLVIDREVLSGETGGAGEAGHMVMQPDGPQCNVCGNFGCLDALAGEQAVIRQVRLAAASDRALAQRFDDPQNPRIEEILQVQRQGHPVVAAIVAKAVGWLGIALANIINLTGPRIVVADGRMLMPEVNRALLEQTTRKNLFGLNGSEVQIVFESYEPFRGAEGAAAYAIRELFIRESVLA